MSKEKTNSEIKNKSTQDALDQIREKFGDHSELIETIKGVGYRFKNF